MSAESNTNSSLFSPKSNTFKNILQKPKEEKKSFGKEEFLARRKFFLQKFENDGGVPKPKPLINNSSTSKRKSNSNIKNSTQSNMKSSNSTIIKSINSNNSEKSNLSNVLSQRNSDWSLSSAKSESLKKIINLTEKKESNTVGKSEFSARQKFFADSQLNSVDQLMPRPATPPGYVYFERCPTQSLDKTNRRNSYGIYSPVPKSPSLSPALSPSLVPCHSPSLSPALSPSLAQTQGATYSLPWEYIDNKKKETQAKAKTQQTKNKVIETLEKQPIVADEIISLPEPVSFNKEKLVDDEKLTVKVENIEKANPMYQKHLEILPEPVKFNTESLSIDELKLTETVIVESIKPQTPKIIIIQEPLPEPVQFIKEKLPEDAPFELITELILNEKMHIPKIIVLPEELPDPVSITKEELPADEPNQLITTIASEGIKQIPKIINIVPEPDETQVKIDKLKSELSKINAPIELDVEETNFKEKNEAERDLLRDFSEQLDETIVSKQSLSNLDNEMIEQPLIEIDNEISINKNQHLIDFDNEIIENPLIQPLIDFDTEISESPLISFDNTELIEQPLIEINEESHKEGSISELLINTSSLSIDDPLPRKSIPISPNTINKVEEVNDLIDLSENEMSNKVKVWYNVVENALSKENTETLKNNELI